MMAGEGEHGPAERRTHADRRAHAEGTAERRGSRRTPGSPLGAALRAAGAIVLLVGVIVFTVRFTRPIFATHGTLGEELRKHAPEAAEVLAPNDSSPIDRLMATAKYQQEKRNFFQDVMRLRQVDSARADSIAGYAVREAYIRGISPAIIFGVMLTENSRFISGAQSNVGAVGLMQVYPKIWLTKQYSDSLGRDLATDSTNVKYGVFILSHYFRPRLANGQRRDRDWATALLRYNGCVRGTNTPNCRTYPSKVRNYVEGSAKSICNGRGFFECIAKPFIEGLFGDAAPARTTVSAGEVSTTASPSPAAGAASVVPAAAPAPPPSPSPSTAPAGRSTGGTRGGAARPSSSRPSAAGGARAPAVRSRATTSGSRSVSSRATKSGSRSVSSRATTSAAGSASRRTSSRASAARTARSGAAARTRGKSAVPTLPRVPEIRLP